MKRLARMAAIAIVVFTGLAWVSAAEQGPPALGGTWIRLGVVDSESAPLPSAALLTIVQEPTFIRLTASKETATYRFDGTETDNTILAAGDRPEQAKSTMQREGIRITLTDRYGLWKRERTLYLDEDAPGVLVQVRELTTLTGTGSGLTVATIGPTTFRYRKR